MERGLARWMLSSRRTSHVSGIHSAVQPLFLLFCRITIWQSWSSWSHDQCDNGTMSRPDKFCEENSDARYYQCFFSCSAIALACLSSKVSATRDGNLIVADVWGGHNTPRASHFHACVLNLNTTQGGSRAESSSIFSALVHNKKRLRGQSSHHPLLAHMLLRCVTPFTYNTEFTSDTVCTQSGS